MEYNDAIAQIRSGRSVLFTGAGFSLGAKNSKGDMRTAYHIANDMYRMCGVGDDEMDGNLISASDWFIKQKGVDQLIEFLNIEFTATDVAKYHIDIAKYNWKRCYTINYDNVLETAYVQNQKHIQAVTPSSDYNAYDKQNVCIHLNGSIVNLNRLTIETEIKLSSFSYAIDSITKTNWWDLLKSDLITCDAIFFIGCSLKSDFDIVRLINKVPDLRRRTFFIVGPQESQRTINVLENYGVVLPIGAEKFVQDINNAPVKFTQVNNCNLKFFSSPTIKTTAPNRDLSHFTKLITEGKINFHLLDYSIDRPDYFPYVLYRERIDVIEDKIKSGIKNFIVYSDLGNGKTIFLHSISYILKRKGYDVFFLDTDLPGAIDEIEYISKNFPSETVVIVENYGDHIEFLDKLNLFRNPNHILILSERRTRYEVSQFLLKNISVDLFFEIPLDELLDSEVDSLITLIDKNYLWNGSVNISSTIHQKRQYIINKCKKRLSQFILRLIKSNSDLRNRYSSVIYAIKHKQEHYQALLYIIVNEVLGFNLTITDIITDLDYDSLYTSDFNKNPNIKELIDFNENKIIFKSSIFASYILKEVLSDEDLKDAMVELFKKLHDKRSNKRIRRQLRDMTKHSNLMKIFHEHKQENKGLLYYMRQIVDLDYCQTSPLFWLQYAIARLFDKDYTNAQICFNNAYELANATNAHYDTFQIDNHYARFLLEARISDYILDEPFSLFIDAHNKLMTIRRGEEQRWYSFKVAENYIPFCERFYNSFSESEKIKFQRCCIEMIERMEQFVRNDKFYEKERVSKILEKMNILMSSL